MKIMMSTGKDERRKLAETVSRILGEKMTYKGVPTFAYEVGDFTVENDGTLAFDDNLDEKKVEKLMEQLKEEGIEQEQKLALVISFPEDKVNMENLQKILDSKGHLIARALGRDEVHFTVKDDKVSFPWFDEMPERDFIWAWSRFIETICKMSLDSKRINAKKKDVQNEKYAFRCFLLRLGFIGAEYKTDRKILLKNLTGSSAFRNGAKHEE